MRPLERFPSTRTSSSGSAVPPPITSTRCPARSRRPARRQAHAAMTSRDGSLAFPSSSSGSSTVAILRALRRLSSTTGDSAMRLSIAGAISSGTPLPSSVSVKSVGGVSPMPCTTFASDEAVQGASTSRSASAVTCSTCPVISVTGGRPHANSSAFRPTISSAAGEATICTSAPCRSSSRASPTDSTAATEPVTASQTVRPARAGLRCSTLRAGCFMPVPPRCVYKNPVPVRRAFQSPAMPWRASRHAGGTRSREGRRRRRGSAPAFPVRADC